jgi:DNA helicase-2/ATP-dependent DNA helicase PcrA
VRILRRHAARLGYPAKFTIYDRGDQESTARQALREIKVSDEHLRPGELVSLVGRWKSMSIRPEQAAAFARSDKEHLASAGYRRYQRALRLAGAVDFDDLLLCCDELFSRFAEVRAAEAGRFSHLLIDEYQDTNAVQYRIVKALAGPHRNLCVVGDDDQSIYGWRGADVSHILQFQRDWPDAKVVRLEHNYRSTPDILELANRLIRFNRKRHEKQLRAALPGGEKPRIWQCADETAEAKRVVDDIRARLANGSAQPRDFAILFRTNEQPRLFEAELRQSKTPYVLVGGMSFYDRREVRDVLAYLKLLAAPGDEVALRRIINTPARGIGPRAVSVLLDEAVARGKPLVEILRQADKLAALPPGIIEAIRGFNRLIDEFRRRLAPGSLAEVVRELITRIGYRDEIARVHREPHQQQARWAAVEEVVNALAAYEQRAARATLAGFLDEVAVADRDDSADKDEQLARNRVALLTLHSAKGLEFPQVYLVGMEEGLLPHRLAVETGWAAIDEERRLCYVGVTRAQRRLTLSLALARMKWGKLRDSTPSRFLFELTGQAERAGTRRSRPKAASNRSPKRRAAGTSPNGTLSKRTPSRRDKPRRP